MKKELRKKKTYELLRFFEHCYVNVMMDGGPLKETKDEFLQRQMNTLNALSDHQFRIEYKKLVQFMNSFPTDESCYE